MTVGTEIRAVNNRQQKLHQTLNRFRLNGFDGNENGGDGDHELLLECGGGGVGGRLDCRSEGVDEAVEVLVFREEGTGEFVEEDEELELEGKGEVLAEKSGGDEISERRI